MKEFLLVAAMVFCVINAQSQVKIGINAGVPVGVASDYYNLSLGGDIYYMFGESKDALLKFGATAGFINYFGDSTDSGGEIDDIQFIPLAIAGRITVLSTLLFGADIGYGIQLGGEDDGGVYGRVVAGLDLGNTVEINAFYHLTKVVKGMDFGSAGLGLLIEL